MYDLILKAYGYHKHSIQMRNVQCWIKDGYSDINVDSSNGWWCVDKTDLVGTTSHQLEGCLQSLMEG